MRRVSALAATLLAAIVIAASVTGTTPARSTSARFTGGVAPVTSTTLICPDVSGTPRGAITTAAIADIAGALRPPSRSTGSVTVTTLAGVHSTSTPVSPVPLAVRRSTPSQQAAVAVAAVGSNAATTVADQLTLVARGRYRGLTGSRCEPPGVDWWFAGADGRIGYTDSLILSNAANTNADVTVSLESARGPLSPPSLARVIVPARSRMVVPIASVAPNAATIAVHVHANSGVVAAALLDRRTRGLAAAGSDFLPPTASPARALTVAGYDEGAGNRQVILANPGSTTATVNVRLVTTSGGFVPAGAGQVVVPGGHTVVVDETRPFAGTTGAVELRSDQPVVAEGFSSVADGHELPDVQWQPAGTPLTDSGAVAAGTEPDGGNCRLLLTASAAAATVVVSTPSGRTQTVTVPAEHSTEAVITGTVGKGPAPAPFVVTVTSGGPVYASRVLVFAGAHGALSTEEPVESLPGPTPLPAVVSKPDLAQP